MTGEINGQYANFFKCPTESRLGPEMCATQKTSNIT